MIPGFRLEVERQEVLQSLLVGLGRSSSPEDKALRHQVSTAILEWAKHPDQSPPSLSLPPRQEELLPPLVPLPSESTTTVRRREEKARRTRRIRKTGVTRRTRRTRKTRATRRIKRTRRTRRTRRRSKPSTLS